jgi:hypothetical protein
VNFLYYQEHYASISSHLLLPHLTPFSASIIYSIALLASLAPDRPFLSLLWLSLTIAYRVRWLRATLTSGQELYLISFLGGLAVLQPPRFGYT